MSRILIYGAGVIGSWYAVLFSQAGYDVTVFARGKRLQTLLEKGLLYRHKGKVRRAKVKVIAELAEKDFYDYILLAVRQTQVREALTELADNQSPTIVTMVNSLQAYQQWEKICGQGRILPAFPGAGGGIEDGILDAALTPKFIQPTTFGEIGGRKTERQQKLAEIFKTSGIPYQIVKDMRAWQICHLAMVVPLAEAYYRSGQPERVGKDRKLMQSVARQLKRNMNILDQIGIELCPKKLHLFRLLPVCFLAKGLGQVYQTDFANRFMYRHSVKASDEMKELHRQFYRYLREHL